MLKIFKNKSYSLTNILFYSLIIVSFLTVLCISIFSIFSDYKMLNKVSQAELLQFTDQEKKNLKSSTHLLSEILTNDYENLQRFLAESAKQQVDGSANVAVDTYKELKGVAPEDRILDEIKRKIELKNRVGKHSVYKIDGAAILEPFKFNPKDIQKIIDDAVAHSGKKYILENGEEVLVHAKKIQNPDVVILYSYLMKSIKNNFAANIASTIKNIKSDKKEYIFILDKDKKEILFSNFSNNQDKDRTAFYKNFVSAEIDKIIASAGNAQGDFLSAEYLCDDASKGCDVIAYVSDMKGFNWILSVGIFTDGLISKVKSHQNVIYQEFTNKIIAYVVYLIIILVVIFIINNFVRINFESNFGKIIKSFSKAQKENEIIPINTLKFNEFKILAENMNKAIVDKNEQEEEKEENLSFLNQYKNAVDISSVLTKTNKNGIIIFANDAFCKISGYDRDEIVGNTHKIVKHPESSSQIYKEAWDTIRRKEIWQGMFKNLSKQGKEYYIQTTIIPILDTDGEVYEYVGIGSDVTALIEQSKKVQANMQDPLTKLPSRAALVENINKNSDNTILASFDISKFKHVNEYYGFIIGDKLLTIMANTLSKLLTNKNLGLYRLNSDNFAIFGDTNEWSAQKMSDFCFELVEYFKQNPIYIKDDKFEIDLAFGISNEPDYFITSEMAKDYAKISENKVVIFSDKKELLMKNVYITQSLKKAIDEDRIVVFKQGIIDNKTKKIAKYECLMRMIDEEGRIISPFVFLEISKSAKLYPKLTKIMIEKTFKYFSKNNDKFSLNFAIEDILSPEIMGFLKENLMRYKSIAHRLTLEIVEDESIENFDEIMAFIGQMREIGVSIAIDDFGSGYSNFEYLVKLKADTIKIDGSLIKNIDKNPELFDMVKLIVEFTTKTNLGTIAEFVASKEIAEIVDSLGIHSSQGFYYDEPKSLESD